tara:strand:+ start:195 stop:329 length:135 start_codon:yes stop_codon:yes gene_type:complete
MMKKICVILFIGILIFSCGKKSDPIYNEENQNSRLNSAQMRAFS